MNKTVILGFASRGVSLAGNLILLPLILVHFTSEEYSIWMVFLSTLSLAIVLDCGFSAVISRYYTYILAGCTKLPDGTIGEKKSHENYNSNVVDKRLYTLLRKSTSNLYIILSALLIVVLVLTWFVYFKKTKIDKLEEVMIAWIIFSISVTLTLYYNKYNAIFFGAKEVTAVYRTALFSGVTYIVISIPMVISDMGLLGLSLSKLISSIVYLIVCEVENRKSISIKYIGEYEFKISEYLYIFNILKPMALRTGVATLGTFIINRIPTLYAFKYLDNVESSSLILLYNLLSTIASVTYIYMNTKTPTLNHFAYRGDLENVKSIQSDIYIKSLCFYFLSCCMFVIFVPEILILIDSGTVLPRYEVIILGVLIYLLEIVLAISINFHSSYNNMSYAKHILFSGIVFIILATLGLDMSANIYVLMGAQLLSQLMFNYWFWPLLVFRKMKTLPK